MPFLSATLAHDDSKAACISNNDRWSILTYHIEITIEPLAATENIKQSYYTVIRGGAPGNRTSVREWQVEGMARKS